MFDPTQTFISVIMPMRNEARYIAKAISAILAQNYPHDKFEILVVDDMSDDQTREIVRGFEAQYINLRLLDNPHQIVPTALNIGLAAAKGKVVIRVDGYAMIAPDYFE